MSLLSSFVAGHVVSALESEFLANEPALQQALLSEVVAFADSLTKWVGEKLDATKPVE